MSKAQKIVLIVGLVVAVVKVLNPPRIVPWAGELTGGVQDIARVIEHSGDYRDNKIDSRRLIFQLLAVGCTTAVAYIFFGRRKAPQAEAAEPKDDVTPN